ncbi:MAG: ChaN family lipoprotein [Lewinella sp.]|nr:ChaN family lipoprotein [Lewinella sp.]
MLLLGFLPYSQSSGYGQKKPAYQLYNAKGKKVTYKKMLRSLSKADIALFGEQHNNPICHWLQLEVVQDLDSLRELSIGVEMFERDNQAALEQYLAGEIDDKALDTLARLWRNYKTDYRPVVDYAKAHGLVFAGTNVPRRYASMVYQGGFEVLDELSAEEKSWMAPLPFPYDPNLPGYQEMLTMMPGHGGENLPKAQALKDATMAHFILKYYQPGQLLLHLNGSFHSDNFDGILWYLKKDAPDLKYVTISSVEQKDIGKLKEEFLGQADFILVIPEDMTKTY